MRPQAYFAAAGPQFTRATTMHRYGLCNRWRTRAMCSLKHTAAA